MIDLVDAPLVQRITPSRKEPIFTRDSMHALRFSPSVSYYKVAVELGCAARPIYANVSDTLNWFVEQEVRGVATHLPRD